MRFYLPSFAEKDPPSSIDEVRERWQKAKPEFEKALQRSRDC